MARPVARKRVPIVIDFMINSSKSTGSMLMVVTLEISYIVIAEDEYV